MSTTGATSDNEGAVRKWIAFAVLVTSILGIVALSAVALYFASDEGRAEMARLVFASVLPLLGTWVGTVLAFYFARENLKAATDSTLDTIRAAGGLAPTTLVTTMMISVADINPRRDVQTKADAGALLLSDLYGDMRTKRQSRVPIFDTSGVVLYIVHEPDIDKFAAIKGVAASALTVTDTFSTLLAIQELEQAVTAFMSVSPIATVADVREKLRIRPECKDVFITVKGENSDRALGWLTSSDLARIV